MKKQTLVIAITLLALICGMLLLIFRSNITKTIIEKAATHSLVSQFKTNSRKAELLITNISFDDKTRELTTRARFTEYDVNNKVIGTLLLDFNGNVIQLQSMVIRLENIEIDNARAFHNKSVYLFWKVFLPSGKGTETIELSPINNVPLAYKANSTDSPREKELWQAIWEYALDPEKSDNITMNNLNVKASGRSFLPGSKYTIKIESTGKLKLGYIYLPNQSGK